MSVVVDDVHVGHDVIQEQAIAVRVMESAPIGKCTNLATQGDEFCDVPVPVHTSQLGIRLHEILHRGHQSYMGIQRFLQSATVMSIKGLLIPTIPDGKAKDGDRSGAVLFEKVADLTAVDQHAGIPTVYDSFFKVQENFKF